MAKFRYCPFQKCLWFVYFVLVFVKIFILEFNEAFLLVSIGLTCLHTELFFFFFYLVDLSTERGGENTLSHGYTIWSVYIQAILQLSHSFTTEEL